ncbi:MAG: DUF1638 domain-containing protein [Candidatus Methanosuratincola petrocarbonis]
MAGGQYRLMRLGIVACEAFRKELEMVTGGDPDVVHKEYLDFGLHAYPETLRRAITEKVNSLEGRVDAVFIGYGICQSLKGISGELRVPALRLDCDDCIATLLTPPIYEAERRKCAGTFFVTPFFAERGMEGMMKELRLDSPKFQRYDKMWFIRRLFDGYSRALFVDTGVGNRERYEALSRAFAEELGLKHEATKGTVSVLAEALSKAKQLAGQKSG